MIYGNGVTMKDIITFNNSIILGEKNIDNYIIYELLDEENRRIIIQRERILHNAYDLSGEFGIGYDYNNNQFYFDLEDYDKIKDYCWNLTKDGYVGGYSLKEKKNVLMHRLLLNVFDNKIVDHINHKKNDNRKINIRIVTSSQNLMNTKMFANNTSGCKGVTWDKSRNKWMAHIKLNGKNKNLGRFANFEDAVRARKNAEEQLFGEYSYDNSQKIGG